MLICVPSTLIVLFSQLIKGNPAFRLLQFLIFNPLVFCLFKFNPEALAKFSIHSNAFPTDRLPYVTSALSRQRSWGI